MAWRGLRVVAALFVAAAAAMGGLHRGGDPMHAQARGQRPAPEPPDLPLGRLYPGVAAVNGRLYVMGGNTFAGSTFGTTARIDIYDLVQRRWLKGADMPSARASFAVAVVGGRIYAIGGTPTDTRESLATVEAYDPGTDRWQGRAPMPTPRSQAGAAAIGGRIFVIGGNADHETAFEVYDAAADRWTRLPGMVRGKRNAAVASVGGLIYTIGGVGTDGSTPLATVDAYDPATGRWNERPSMPTPRTDHAATVAGERIVVLGGVNRGFLDIVETFEVAAGRWARAESLTLKRGFHQAVRFDDRILVVGGTDRLPGTMSAIEAYDYAPGADVLPRPGRGRTH